MSLFTDCSTPTLTDVLKYDANVLNVATTEGLDLDEKVELARQQVGAELSHFLKTYGSGEALDAIVVNEPLSRWVTHTALSLLYRDAHYSQLNDRYRAKWQEFVKSAEKAADLLYRTGVGMVLAPVRRPPKPIVGQISGVQAANSYFVRISWVANNGVESEASELASHLLSEPGGVRVTPPAAIPGVSYWNVFVGHTTDTVSRQNAEPLEATENWVLPETGVIDGALPTSGQQPDYEVRRIRRLWRG